MRVGPQMHRVTHRIYLMRVVVIGVGRRGLCEDEVRGTQGRELMLSW